MVGALSPLGDQVRAVRGRGPAAGPLSVVALLMSSSSEFRGRFYTLKACWHYSGHTGTSVRDVTRFISA